ncbi:MAG: hypothetical protein ACK5BJ_07435 [Bacteroidota bacterium]|nr:hypothetical protein [Cytophagales bacterium]
MKKYLAFFCLFIVTLYTVGPYFFEKNFFLNEILSLIGLIVFATKGFKIKRSAISLNVLLLIGLGMAHAIVSLFVNDGWYFYFRNTVIVYSIFSFFFGYFIYSYFFQFVVRFRAIITNYVLIFLIFPITNLFYDRFGMSVLFPAIFKPDAKKKWILPSLAILVAIYSIRYESSTILLLSFFYAFILFFPNYNFLKISFFFALLSFSAVFIYLLPNLSLIENGFSFFSTDSIWNVINSHPLLKVDPNSTWRLVIWKQLIVDAFPGNLLGIGFGTPALKYFPVEDYSKLDTLPYVLGAHNSFIYLFNRLGVLFLFMMYSIYKCIFKEYFRYRKVYSVQSLLLFYSFFAITFIALFNPTLETPIYASSFWITLGLVGRAIDERKLELDTVERQIL